MIEGIFANAFNEFRHAVYRLEIEMANAVWRLQCEIKDSNNAIARAQLDFAQRHRDVWWPPERKIP